MSDGWIFGVSLFGLVLSIVYIALLEFKKVDKASKCYFRADEKIDVLLKDYEITNNEITRRENITLIIGTILIAASFFIVSRVFSETFFETNGNKIHLAALASIGLYALWLFGVHLTTKRLDDIAYARMKSISERITKMSGYQRGSEFGIHKFIASYIKRNGLWWIWFRRRFWGWTLMFLSFYWILFSGYLQPPAFNLLLILTIGIIFVIWGFHDIKVKINDSWSNWKKFFYKRWWLRVALGLLIIISISIYYFQFRI